MLREENNRYRTEDVNTIKTLQMTLASVQKELEASRKTNAILTQKLAEAEDKNANNNRTKFGHTSEQARLLNNRETDTRSREKDKLDGGGQSVEGQQGTTSAEAAPQQEKKKPRRRTVQVEPEDKHVDETTVHRLTDYHNLPEGAHYVTRNGKIDIHYFEYIEYLPARVVRHVYEVARVADGDTIVSSLPDEVKEKAAAKGCPFDARLMAFILCEKYAYHSSINTI